MYLQSLEIIGFKSFAPKTTLNFHRGVTAIVGPNGCGKSNVLDSIRWVLGEQSAKALRGGEMADVIFSGTDSRAALGMAEVSMTFSECEAQLGVEWNEVRITRRVYRDGKSEYFLNKTACRLRDIHELFMDTGVGRSAYSIMEQGKIDQILSSRPEDRRAIFEEAAGITKYKSQKKEALRKLEYTEANLLRVQDIIKEVKRQIGSLQRQAAKARRYQALMQDLRTFDTHLSHRTYGAFHTELSTLRSELTKGDATRQLHEDQIGEQEGELAVFRARIGELEVEATGLREGIQALKNQIFGAESRITANSERSKEASEMIVRYRNDIASAEEKIRTQQSQLEQTDSLLQQMIEALRTHEATLNEHTEKLRLAREGRVQVERTIQQAASDIARNEARFSTLQSQIAAAAGRREAGETRLSLLQGESELARVLAGELTAILEDLTQRSDNARLGLEASQADVSSSTAAHEEAQQSLRSAESVLNLAGKEAAGIESRLEILRQLQEQGEGFDEGTQAVLRGLDNPGLFRPAIRGALAQTIQVEPDFISAIEAALGSALQAIVFSDSAVAESALLVLSTGKLGRASVIPTDWIVAASAARLTLPVGAIGWAADHISGQGDGVLLAQKLVENYALVGDLAEAFRLREENPETAFATLAGESITAAGIVQGGVIGGKTGQSTLQRKAQIAELDRALTAATERIQTLANEKATAAAALDDCILRLQSARDAVQKHQIESASLDNERRHIQRQLSETDARCAAFARETNTIEESLRSSLAQLSELEASVSQASEGLEASRAARGKAEAEILSAREHENTASDTLNEIRVRIATERQQQQNLHSQRGPMSARLVELSELLDTRRVDISNYERRTESLTLENGQLQQTIATAGEALQEEERKIQALVTAKSENAASADALEIALRAARQSLAQLQSERSRIEVRTAQTEMRMENVRNHVSQRYQTDLELFQPDTYALLAALRDRAKRTPDAAQDGEANEPEEQVPADEETIPWERIEEIVAELTERVESMGPVNVEAIQEFDELEQRYVFLEQQNADLVNSKAELLEVISKINRTTKGLFAETFEKIRVNFQEMFTELFGGGRANLMLVDDSDPLESGIEIIAKPPGKQLQSVSLLSGGERTMTAVSLLFAIYMVKPSPFCVLDEMDAPLDESNISRFVKILDRFVGQSQFVVITHNKRTISRADMLYGVTMEEHGVSKLVSVKFSGKAEGESQSISGAFGKSGDLAGESSLV